ncbi:TRAP transporter substrate-binding protein DctP [Loktanella sp. M215]|uniref:TRAP transporter substrate-binding protein DctP n=1 Tax=Loktanella sp. M215 TaxID=2675431 RepID=UPI001F01CCFB|nr:TRAP transporter substrate-binding protein DctP [Loktanella sp. M215]
MFKQAATAVALSFCVAAPAVADELRMIVSWPETNTMAWMPGAQFKSNLEAENVDLTVAISGPESVPPFEQITPTSTGVFDVIYTYPAYHSKALTVVTNAMEPDMEKIRSSGVFDMIDSYFQQEHNLKLLANVAVGSSGYHCYLKQPLSDDGTWSGRKLRGVSTYVPVIEALGGVAVNTPMSEVYAGIERGVVDGACAPQSVYRATKHYEVAPYRTEPTFGQLVSYIAMNLDTWNGLSDAQKAAVESAAIKTEADTIRIGNEANAEDMDAVAAAGSKVAELPDVQYQKVLSAYYDGVWALAAECCGAELTDEIRQTARDAGLTE